MRRLLPAFAASAMLVGGLMGGIVGAAPASATGSGQWWLDALDVPAAWAATKGAGVTVAIVDSGVDGSHPDLAGAVQTGADYAQAIGPGEHATGMASLVAGRGVDGGVLGVAPESRVLSVQVLAEGRPQAADADHDPVARGIRYAVDHGAGVISLSLGSVELQPRLGTPAQDDAVQYALAHGVVVVAAAGNGGDVGSVVSYPAGYPGVIVVGALDRSGGVAPFSTRNWTTTVAAPGVDISAAVPGGGYATGDGTSQATALVSGVVALIRSAAPQLSPLQVRALLVSTASGHGWTTGRGYGEVDAAAAVSAAHRTAPAGEAPQPASYRQPWFGPAPPKPAGIVDATAPDGHRLGRGLVEGAAALLLVICGVYLLHRSGAGT